MDVVVSHQFGVKNAVATLGTSLTTQHAQVIKRYCDSVILMFDSDKAGIDAAKRAIETLLDFEISIKVVILPEGMDSDDYLNKEGKDNFLKFIDDEKKSFIEFLSGLSEEKSAPGTLSQKLRQLTKFCLI